MAAKHILSLEIPTSSNCNIFTVKDTSQYIDDLDVLFGGVVCCGFSMAGNRNPFDERNYLNGF